jgi:hypothetical protein
LDPVKRNEAIRRYAASAEESSPAASVDLASIDEVLEIHERVLLQLPEEHPDRPLVQLLQTLLRLVRERYAEDGLAERSTEQMIEMASQLMELMPPLITYLTDRGIPRISWNPGPC